MPEQVRFATKPELAQVMLERALVAGAPASWVTADEVYGGSPGLRACWRPVGCRTCWPCGAPSRFAGSWVATSAAVLAASIPPECWLRINAGHGAKGRRWHAWSCLLLSPTGAPAGWGRWLLVHRHLATGELAFYCCAAPDGLPLVALVKVAGCRWRIEETFQQAKGLCGLDEHQVRRWASWSGG